MCGVSGGIKEACVGRTSAHCVEESLVEGKGWMYMDPRESTIGVQASDGGGLN